ncbi:MAG: SET domain-containing protein [Bacteroidota bacterium]
MTKQELLLELQNQTWVALKPSSTHGIGVFAICDIPKGTRSIFSKDSGNYIPLSFVEVEQLPPHSKNFIETYYLYDESHYFIPAHGCKVMDMANYLNHSSEPNIISVEEGLWFEALRNIKEGEELFVDYGEIVEGMEGY